MDTAYGYGSFTTGVGNFPGGLDRNFAMQVPAPKIVFEVVHMEVGYLAVRFDICQASHIFGQRIGLHASGVHPVIEQLLADAVVCIKGGDFLYISNLGVELDHCVVVPIGHLEHPLVLVHSDFFKGDVFHFRNGSHLVPSYRNGEPVE